MLQSDELGLPEEDVLEIVVKWCLKNNNNRKSEPCDVKIKSNLPLFDQFAPDIRWEVWSFESLFKIIDKYNLFSAQDTVHIMKQIVLCDNDESFDLFGCQEKREVRLYFTDFHLRSVLQSKPVVSDSESTWGKKTLYYHFNVNITLPHKLPTFKLEGCDREFYVELKQYEGDFCAFLNIPGQPSVKPCFLTYSCILIGCLFKDNTQNTTSRFLAKTTHQAFWLPFMKHEALKKKTWRHANNLICLMVEVSIFNER